MDGMTLYLFDQEKRYIQELEKKIKDLEEENRELKDENRELKEENKDIKEQLTILMSSALVLGASDKTAEAGGVPSSHVFYKQDRSDGEKKQCGGQPGHKGHGRKRPDPNSPPLHVTLDSCPNCNNSDIREIKSAVQRRTITDIPPFQIPMIYDVFYHRYWCGKCKKLVRGSVPWLPPNKEFGPFIACRVAYLRMLGLSLPKIQDNMYETYGIKLSEAEILELEKWIADSLHEDYEKLKEITVKAGAVNGDETRFRIGGENGWLWVFVHTLGSLYEVAPTRGSEVPTRILKGFHGVLGRDGYKSYDAVDCSEHQLDLVHVNRWLERAEVRHGVEPRTLLTSKPAKMKQDTRIPEEFVTFADGIRSLLKKAIEYSEKKPPPPAKERKDARVHFQDEMKKFLDQKWDDKDAIRISKELRRRLNMLFTFVEKEDVPWHNNDAENAIRKGVLARKISGGRRTWTGAEVFQVLLSIFETSKKKGENFNEVIKKRLDIPFPENRSI